MASLRTTSARAIRLHPDDNIAVMLAGGNAGDVVEIGNASLSLAEPIRMGHKVALASLAENDSVRKYGQVIGTATESIGVGEWVHSHNLATGAIACDYAVCSGIPSAPSPITGRSFMGYRRANGKAGTRNYIAIISTVNCSATVSKYIAQHFNRDLLDDFPNIDGVVAFKHEGGCAMRFGGLKHQMLNRVMGGIAKHPNIGAFLVVGLGCEQASIGHLLSEQRLVTLGGRPTDANPLNVFSIQDQGGTVKTVEAGVRQITSMLPSANDVRREPIPLSELILGTECGGSDGNSGITANPAVGIASDRIVAAGGTTILAETPEIAGAEHLLTRRSRTPEVAERLLERLAWWREYSKMFDEEFDSNPSVGNKEGGLTTIAEKSLGAVSKGGTTALEAVYHYAEPVTKKGFVVMDSPGFDPMSVTGMMAGGANVMVFTTGRGSCFGCKPTPCIKIATNTPMYEQMQDDMDINAGEILADATVESVGEQIFEKVIAVASGEKTKSEIHGMGDEEFVPWTVGPTL